MRFASEKFRVRSSAAAAFLLVVSFFVVAAFRHAAYANEQPRLIILDVSALLQIKKRLQSNGASFLPALRQLKRDADRALGVETFAVTNKELAPPGGDKHDYMSIAPYWWPDPQTPNGLPYIRRDGEVNPESAQTSDRKRLDQMIQAVKTLALAFFFIGRDDYATHAARLLRHWFFNDATKMNPHLRYAQAVPGRNQGRGAGIIETHNLPELLDAVALLSGSKAWTKTDQRRLQEWFSGYLAWLVDSPEGRIESKAQNNHASWYDVQVAAYALFAGRDELAKTVLAEFSSKRIAQQIAPDGRQPQELARAQAWNYSLFNLEAFFSAAASADKVGIDLWNYQTNDKRSIRKALDWLMPFATGEKKWSYKQISPYRPEKLARLLRRAAFQYREPIYEQALGKLPKIAGDERWQLLYPKIREPK